MYNTHHRRQSALDEYLASVSDESLVEAETESSHAPIFNTSLKTKVLQTVLPHIVNCIHRAAPSHTKTELLKDLAFAHAAWTTTAVGTPSLSPQSFLAFVQTRASHILCSAVVFAAIATTFLTTDATSAWPPWQRSMSFAVAGLTLLHVLFPLFDLAVLSFYVVGYRRQCRDLANLLTLLHEQKEMLEVRCNHVLRLVKSAAAAQRGYLLDDAWMPPIGRLEANETAPSLSCVHLRQTLHAIYTSVAAASADDHPLPPVHAPSIHSPSLLLMALSNQHIATMQFLDQLLADWRIGVDSPLKLGQVLGEVDAWQGTLKRALHLVDEASSDDEPSEESSTRKVPSSPLPIATNATAHHAKVLQSTLKTALAVLFALEKDTGFDSSKDPERLKLSQARVGELLDAAQAAWSKWHGAVLEDNQSDKPQEDYQGAEGAPVEPELQQPTAPVENADVAPAYTQVFTAVSTGRTDTEASQEHVVGSISPIETFNHVVHELHDVLVRRPLPEERVQGDDTPVATITSKPTEEPKATHAFILPTMVSSELQATLLHLQRRPAAEEEFLSYDDDE